MWEMMGNITSADLIFQAEESRRAIRETAEAHQVVIDELRRENAELKKKYKNTLIDLQQETAVRVGFEARAALLDKLHTMGRTDDAYRLTNTLSKKTGKPLTLASLTFNEAYYAKMKEYGLL